MDYQGLVSYLGYFIAFFNEVLAHLFDLTPSAATIWFDQPNRDDGGVGQWVLKGTEFPPLTQKSEDIVAAIMTIAHNGLVAVAQLSTLLPANALTP